MFRQIEARTEEQRFVSRHIKEMPTIGLRQWLAERGGWLSQYDQDSTHCISIAQRQVGSRHFVAPVFAAPGIAEHARSTTARSGGVGGS